MYIYSTMYAVLYIQHCIYNTVNNTAPYIQRCIYNTVYTTLYEQLDVLQYSIYRPEYLYIFIYISLTINNCLQFSNRAIVGLWSDNTRLGRIKHDPCES